MFDKLKNVGKKLIKNIDGTSLVGLTFLTYGVIRTGTEVKNKLFK